MPQIDFSGDRLYLEQPNAADKDAIIQWTLEEFSRLKMDKKILLLQYGDNFADFSRGTNHRNFGYLGVWLDIIPLTEMKLYASIYFSLGFTRPFLLAVIQCGPFVTLAL
jgi:hypothetical protein